MDCCLECLFDVFESLCYDRILRSTAHLCVGCWRSFIVAGLAAVSGLLVHLHFPIGLGLCSACGTWLSVVNTTDDDQKERYGGCLVAVFGRLHAGCSLMNSIDISFYPFIRVRTELPFVGDSFRSSLPVGSP